MGVGLFSVRGRAALGSFWLESGGRQLQAMREGLGVIVSGDLGLAREQMIKDTAASYESRIMMHYASGAYDINAAISSASGWRMVCANLIGFTDLGVARVAFVPRGHSRS